ncbi:MAG: hypothetical protein OES79_14545 [Planctomycetota bacterium]|nr:hypothetical protein [Planctomycetota bacterium]
MKDSPIDQLLLAKDGERRSIGSVRGPSKRQQSRRDTAIKVKNVNYHTQNLLDKRQAKFIGELGPFNQPTKFVHLQKRGRFGWKMLGATSSDSLALADRASSTLDRTSP